jgi:8-oxo-dGTP diphosphatase
MPNFIYEFPRPAVTVDIVVFSIKQNQLEILLIQRGKEPYQGKWALPGGFVGIDEPLRSAAERELEEETGLSKLHLEQLFTFGSPNRDPRGRIITVSYCSIINQSPTHKTAGASDAKQAKWFPIVDLPPLAFDHDEIISFGLKKLRNDLVYTIIDFKLLPEVFTLKMLQNIFEIIQDVNIEKQKFIQYILAADILEPAPTKIDSINHAEQLFKLKIPRE